ncbi:MAG TPA: NAD(P)-binding domain-containing protein, partial [Hyphomicrobiaceae bacterium]|nr:NAD(P)-binding domain-containing protein [Hyphomicrobiaceae bacterium]
LHDRQSKYCIIGAGASGLAAAKTFVERGIPFDCLEREADIGGLWNIATPSGVVYETTHLVSCISSTGFDDMPMLDEDYPEYPGHARVLGYFRDFVAKYGLMEHIELGKAITEVAPRADGRWDVVVAGEASPRVYRGVVIASGHHDTPRMPVYPGTFSGEILHSRAYKSPRQLRDQRVLVVGCGNSAADIVTDAVHGGSEVFLSIRRGYWFVPKFILGFPTGDILGYGEMAPLPRRVKSWLFQAVLWLVQGPPSRYRMPDPDYRIDQAHPTMTDEIPRLVAHGDLTIKPEIAGYDGNRVLFKDGSAEAVDTIVFATGYQPIIPYIDEGLIFARDGRPRFLVNVVHPEQENLFAVGLTQANGSMWRTADYQSQLVANLIVAAKHAPDEARSFRQWLADHAARAGRRSYVASDRHRLEVNYYDYRRLMKRLNRRFGAVRAMKLGSDRSAGAERTLVS